MFILVQQGLFGLYLGASFAPNHKGMPILDATDRSDFLRRQVLTSRNVRGGWLTDLALGGLNYQIEHHLFPSMPQLACRRRSQALIKEFCQQRGLPYCEASSREGSYAQALRYLNTIGKPSRPITGPPLLASAVPRPPRQTHRHPPTRVDPASPGLGGWGRPEVFLTHPWRGMPMTFS